MNIQEIIDMCLSMSDADISDSSEIKFSKINYEDLKKAIKHAKSEKAFIDSNVVIRYDGLGLVKIPDPEEAGSIETVNISNHELMLVINIVESGGIPFKDVLQSLEELLESMGDKVSDIGAMSKPEILSRLSSKEIEFSLKEFAEFVDFSSIILKESVNIDWPSHIETTMYVKESVVSEINSNPIVSKIIEPKESGVIPLFIAGDYSDGSMSHIVEGEDSIMFKPSESGIVLSIKDLDGVHEFNKPLYIYTDTKEDVTAKNLIAKGVKLPLGPMDSFCIAPHLAVALKEAGLKNLVKEIICK